MNPDSRFGSAARTIKALACLSLVVVASAVAREAAAFAYYTSRAAWEAAVGAPVTTDHFSNPVANAASILFDTGIVSTHEDFDHFGSANVFADANAIFAGSGRYQGRAMSDAKEIIWVFPTPVFAFGADWISPLSLGRLTVTGNFDGTGMTTVGLLGPLEPDTDGFFGIVGAGSFASIVLGTESTSQNEAFAADDLSFASGIPEPGTQVLLVAGLAALGRRRRALRH